MGSSTSSSKEFDLERPSLALDSRGPFFIKSSSASFVFAVSLSFGTEPYLATLLKASDALFIYKLNGRVTVTRFFRNSRVRRLHRNEL